MPGGVSISQLAPPAVSLLVVILAYGSQVFFRYIEPYKLEHQQTLVFNTMVACIWICYARACWIDPGHVPVSWVPDEFDAKEHASGSHRYRWCRKCEAFKPPRAHHCKTCNRCIPKMDHHCPWTVNCVSHRTFPHFMRFLFYAVVSMSYLEHLLYLRASIVWENRSLPSYLGPSPAQLIILFLYLILNSVTLFALAVMFLRSLWSLWTNTTTIESWEIERHQTLLRRSRAFGGYLEGADGVKVQIEKQEFPYDIGIWSNITQGMCGGPVTWLWPLAKSYPMMSGLSFEVNGFEDASVTWPPPDPDRIPRKAISVDPDSAFIHADNAASNEEQLEAFRKRQEQDFKRYRADAQPFLNRHEEQGEAFQEQDLKRNQTGAQPAYHRQPFHKRYDGSNPSGGEAGRIQGGLVSPGDGEETWRNSEGDRLDDFGVDETVEFYDEDDFPLAELLSRRRMIGSSEQR